MLSALKYMKDDFITRGIVVKDSESNLHVTYAAI